MNAIVRSWRLTAIVLAFSIVVAPLPALAGEHSTTALKPSPGIRTSVEKIVATERLATSHPVATARQQQPGTTTDLGSKNFFKTPGGIATLIALGVGVGYALYSTSHDRVKSPAR